MSTRPRSDHENDKSKRKGCWGFRSLLVRDRLRVVQRSDQHTNSSSNNAFGRGILPLVFSLFPPLQLGQRKRKECAPFPGSLFFCFPFSHPLLFKERRQTDGREGRKESLDCGKGAFCVGGVSRNCRPPHPPREVAERGGSGTVCVDCCFGCQHPTTLLRSL